MAKHTNSVLSPYNSLYVNPLTDSKQNHIFSSEGDLKRVLTDSDNKENDPIFGCNKENAKPANTKPLSTSGSLKLRPKQLSDMKSLSTGRALKPNSLQFCMQMDEPQKGLKYKLWDPVETEKSASSSNIWDYSDSEAAPASSWSTLPNRALLCRPLPVDIGRCNCIIVKEALPQGLNGGSLFSLYTNEGQGRQDRKLAMAHHKRHNGKSVFTIAQNLKGVLSTSDDSFIGSVTANFMGSKYLIWNQGSNRRLSSPSKQQHQLLSVVRFVPTVATCTGSYRSMRVYIPKHKSMQLKNTTQHTNCLPKDWETEMDKVHKLYSRPPNYNNNSKQYELDYRDRGKTGYRIQSSVKNFQLKLEEHGKQTILQLGRVGKSKFVMDFRYPLSGYQAFCICLSSIDSKLCCTV